MIIKPLYTVALLIFKLYGVKFFTNEIAEKTTTRFYPY